MKKRNFGSLDLQYCKKFRNYNVVTPDAFFFLIYDLCVRNKISYIRNDTLVDMMEKFKTMYDKSRFVLFEDDFKFECINDPIFKLTVDVNSGELIAFTHDSYIAYKSICRNYEKEVKYVRDTFEKYFEKGEVFKSFLGISNNQLLNKALCNHYITDLEKKEIAESEIEMLNYSYSEKERNM